MKSPGAWCAVLLGGMSIVALGVAGCDGDSKPQVMLLTVGTWNDNPSTVAETGYQVSADVGWPDRQTSCFPLSANLRIRVNDGEAAPMVYGDCRWDVVGTVGPFQQNVPITVRLEDGDQLLAEAVYNDLFPGADAQLVAPAAGQPVKVGDPVVLTMPVPPVAGAATYAEFYWLDAPPAGVPPFHTFATGTVSADGSTFQTTAPSTTGHAAVILKSVFSGDITAASICTGFQSCDGEPNGDTIGPVFVEVVP
jgi:hypothetical protein